MARAIVLAEDASNGTGTTYDWDGGEGVLHAGGTWDDASVTLQYAPLTPLGDVTQPTPSDTDVLLSSSEPNRAFNRLPAGKVRVVIADGGGSESLTVIISRDK